MVKLVRISDELACRWDSLIGNYSSKRLFHNMAWLNYLEKSQNGKKLIFEIRDNSRLVGYFCALSIKKGPFKILGSPLRGWNTFEMGPIMNRNLNQIDVVQAISDYAKNNEYSVLELSNSLLEPKVMRAAGFSFYKKYTYVVKLMPGEKERMFENLTSVCRNRIRKGVNNKLSAKDISHPIVAERYYTLLKKVFFKKWLAPPYKKSKVNLLFEILKPVGMLISMQVSTLAGEIIAIGLYPHDNRTLFFYGGASKGTRNHLYPNELLHWSAMLEASNMGIESYDMGGVTSKEKSGIDKFKRKFEGRKEEILHWQKFYSPVAKAAYSSYRALIFLRQKIFFI